MNFNEMPVLFPLILLGLLLSCVAATIQANPRYIKIDNVERSYRLYAPQEAALPGFALVIVLHGNGGNAEALVEGGRKKSPYKIWLDIAKREKLIVAVPNGSAGPNGKTGWNDCRKDAVNNPATDDIGFIRGLIDEIAMNYPVDRSRIYATGTSNGGHFAIRLAIELSDRMAAVAAIVAAMPKNSKCSTSNRPVPILFMNGTRDPILPFHGGIIAKKKRRGRGEALSARATIDWWLARNRADKQATVSVLKDRSRRDKSRVVKYCHPGSNQGAPVLVYEIDGGGHTEPSIEQRYSRIYKRFVGNQNGDIEMAEEVWQFFASKKKAVTPGGPSSKC